MPVGKLISSLLIACVVVILAATAASADVVVLKNGDRITGRFVSVNGGTLRIQTDTLGAVTIPVSQVEELSVAEAVVIVVRGQPPIRGELSLESGEWQVTDGGMSYTIGISVSSVIVPVHTYQSVVQHVAYPWQDWAGTAALGYSVQRGDQETNTFSSTVDVKRERPASPIFSSHLRTNAHLTMLLSDAADEAGGSIGSNTVSASVRQDELFAPGDFVFGIVQIDHVGAQGLSRRETYGGGLGYDLVTSGRGTVSLLAGLTFVREAFVVGSTTPSGQGLVGEKVRYQLTRRVRLDHTATVYPNLSVAGQYHLDTNTALSIKLTNRFSLNTGLIDLYLSNPAPASERNNLGLTTGIAATF